MLNNDNRRGVKNGCNGQVGPQISDGKAIAGGYFVQDLFHRKYCTSSYVVDVSNVCMFSMDVSWSLIVRFPSSYVGCMTCG